MSTPPHGASGVAALRQHLHGQAPSSASRSIDQSWRQPQVKQDEERRALYINDTMPIDRSCSTAKTRAVVSNPQVPTRVSCIGAITFFQSGQRPSPFTRLSYHLSKLPGLTTSPPQLLLLEQVNVVHLDLSSSLGLRFEPLIVLFRLRISALTPSSAFFFAMSSVLFHGTCSCGMMSMSRRTALTCYNNPTGLHPSRTGWFHDLDSLRGSRQHVPGATQRHCDR